MASWHHYSQELFMKGFSNVLILLINKLKGLSAKKKTARIPRCLGTGCLQYCFQVISVLWLAG